MDVKSSDGNLYAAVATGNVPVKALTAQTAVNVTGTTPSSGTVDLGCVRNNHTLQVNPATGSTGGVVKIYTSLDGVNWFASASVITLTNANPQQVVLTNTPSRFIAAVVTTLISGGSGPAIDAWLGSF